MARGYLRVVKPEAFAHTATGARTSIGRLKSTPLRTWTQKVEEQTLTSWPQRQASITTHRKSAGLMKRWTCQGQGAEFVGTSGGTTPSKRGRQSNRRLQGDEARSPGTAVAGATSRRSPPPDTAGLSRWQGKREDRHCREPRTPPALATRVSDVWATCCQLGSASVSLDGDGPNATVRIRRTSRVRPTDIADRHGVAVRLAVRNSATNAGGDSGRFAGSTDMARSMAAATSIGTSGA